MRGYITRRLLLILPTIFLVTIICFCLVRFIPGHVIDLMEAEFGYESAVSREVTVAQIRTALGMDVPIHIQYARWIGDALRGDLGSSLWRNIPVTEELTKRLPVSVELGLLGIITAIIIALPIGIYSAIRQDTFGDYGGRTIAILFISLPSFWVATLIIVYPSIWFGWSPRVEYVSIMEDFRANIGQFIIPALIMGMVMSGTTMRMTRTMMLEVLRQDYIRTAWSKGLRERTVILRHALRNALIPVITIIGIMTPMVIAGQVVLEQIFCLPGVGLLLLEAINKRDYPIISGVNLTVALWVLTINIVVDLTYAWLDPRVSYK